MRRLPLGDLLADARLADRQQTTQLPGGRIGGVQHTGCFVVEQQLIGVADRQRLYEGRFDAGVQVLVGNERAVIPGRHFAALPETVRDRHAAQREQRVGLLPRRRVQPAAIERIHQPLERFGLDVASVDQRVLVGFFAEPFPFQGGHERLAPPVQHVTRFAGRKLLRGLSLERFIEPPKGLVADLELFVGRAGEFPGVDAEEENLAVRCGGEFEGAVTGEALFQ